MKTESCIKLYSCPKTRKEKSINTILAYEKIIDMVTFKSVVIVEGTTLKLLIQKHGLQVTFTKLPYRVTKVIYLGKGIYAMKELDKDSILILKIDFN